MKIFDASPDIGLARPSRRPLIVAICVGVLLIVGFSTALVSQQRGHQSEKKKLVTELAAARATAAGFETQLEAAKAKARPLEEQASSCSLMLSSEMAKVSAFAKQAAACEVIRTKLNTRGQ